MEIWMTRRGLFSTPYRMSRRIRIMPGRRTARLPLSRLIAVTVVWLVLAMEVRVALLNAMANDTITRTRAMHVL